MRLLVGLLLLLASPAFAAPCTEATFYDGFAGQFFGTTLVTGFMYGLDETYMYVTETNGKISGYINVPQSTAQNFNYSKTPDTFYKTQIKYVYRRPLMTETCQNLLTEDNHYLLAF